MTSRFLPGFASGKNHTPQSAASVQLFNPLLALTAAGSSSVVSSSMSLYLPTGYESHYPYPLVVWLHGDDSSEKELQELFPRMSERNYVAVAFRGPVGTGGRYSWTSDEESLAAFEQVLYPTLCALRKTYHIHSERIYLAGKDRGAAMALQLLLHRPEWFRAAVGFSSAVPAVRIDNPRHPLLVGSRVLLNRLNATSADDQPTRDFQAAVRLYQSLGLDVTLRNWPAESSDEVFPAALLHDWNCWLMSDITSASLV